MTVRPEMRADALIVRKGEAAPESDPVAEVIAPARASPAAPDSTPWLTPADIRGEVKALTVKLDRGSYERFKIIGIRRRMSSQEMAYKAIREWMDREEAASGAVLP